MTKHGRGVLMYAFNNSQIEYVKIAIANAYLVKHHMNVKCALITDEFSWNCAVETLGATICNDAFCEVIKVKKDKVFNQNNIRTYRDTVHAQHRLSFYNVGRVDAYDLTPFKETLVIDADYLILGDSLNQCWGHLNDIMINHDYVDALEERSFSDTKRVNNTGIDMYWATVFYFKKSHEAEMWFELLTQVRDNYTYYHSLYNCDNSLFRNDYVFSIAAHMYMGFTGEHMDSLPVNLINSFDRDALHSVKTLDEIVMALEKPCTEGDFILTNFKYNNIHIMNKWALSRVSNEILDKIC